MHHHWWCVRPALLTPPGTGRRQRPYIVRVRVRSHYVADTA